MTRLNDPELVRAEYADEAGLAARMAVQQSALLVRHFTTVERRDVRGTVTFPDPETARRHVSACPTRGELADRLPDFGEPLVATRHVAVFVCEP